jgi:O-antigen ligase
MIAIGRGAANVIIWTIVLLLLVLPAFSGSGGSVPAALLSLLLVPVLASRARRREIARQPAMLIFVGAFIAILAAYGLSAREPGNLLYATALLGLPGAVLLYGAMDLWKVARPAATLTGAWLLGVMFCGVVALNSSFLMGAERAVGFLMGPNFLARLALILAFLGLAALFLTRSPFRYLAYLGMPLALGVLVLSGTRGAFVAIPGMGLVLAGFLATDRREWRHLTIIVVLGVAGLALVFFGTSRFDAMLALIGEVLKGGATADNATAERVFMVQGGFRAFLHSPIWGFGWANLRPAAALTMDMTRYGTDPGGAFQFHNDFANFAVASGLIGMLSLIAIYFAPVLGALAGPRDRYFRARLYCCLQLTVGYIAFGVTDLSMGYELPTTLYALLTAMILAVFREKRAV